MVEFLCVQGIEVLIVNKLFEGCLNIVDVIKNGEYVYIVNIMEGCQVIIDLVYICCEVLLNKVIYIIIMNVVFVMVQVKLVDDCGKVMLVQELYVKING